MKAAGHEANPLAFGRFQAEHHEKVPSRKAGLSDMAEGLALLHGAADDERAGSSTWPSILLPLLPLLRQVQSGELGSASRSGCECASHGD